MMDGAGHIPPPAGRQLAVVTGDPSGTGIIGALYRNTSHDPGADTAAVSVPGLPHFTVYVSILIVRGQINSENIASVPGLPGIYPVMCIVCPCTIKNAQVSGKQGRPGTEATVSVLLTSIWGPEQA